MSAKERNKCLDVFKGIACLAVVFLHVRLPFETIDGILQSAARFAVPLFFMVSGYYCYYADSNILVRKLPKKIKHIGFISIISLVYWVLIQFAVACFGTGDHSLKNVIFDMISLKSLFDFLVFNADPVINILWFVFALLYVYVIMYLFAKVNKINVLLYLTPILLAIHFLMGNVAYAFDTVIKIELYRNCWFMGLPLFMIGYLIKKENMQAKINSNMARNLIFAGLVLSVIEWIIIGGRQQMYIGSIITAIAMIIYSEHSLQREVSTLLYNIGNKYSLFIYVTHISIGIVFDRITKVINAVDSIVYLTIKPILVIVGSIVFAITFYKIINFIKELRNNETAKS